MQLSDHFMSEEFGSPDLPGSGINMDEDFIRILESIRVECGFSFYVNSGYRTRTHNSKVGGAVHSAHCKGLAADIRCLSNYQRYKIIQVAMNYKVTRIGIGKNFIHLDIDTDLPHPRIWFY